MFADVYAGRRVFVTGHTGFKGAWLTQWLLDLGACDAPRDAAKAPGPR
jgi:CDP-glucose 4,6-dehydratase